MTEKRFSLFNTSRYTPEKLAELNEGLPKPIFYAVPVLYSGPNNEQAIRASLDRLRVEGSLAVPFMDPEGIVIFHTASGHLYKKTLKDDEKPKSEV